MINLVSDTMPFITQGLLPPKTLKPARNQQCRVPGNWQIFFGYPNKNNYENQ